MVTTLAITLTARQQGTWFIIANLAILAALYAIPRTRRAIMRPFDEGDQ